jgi:hypothetical protein
MTQKDNSFKIVYNSDLIIRDASQAATLCVFYDQVILPHVGQTSSLYPVSRELVHQDGGGNAPGPLSPLVYERAIRELEQLYGTLFDAEVLVRLPPVESHKPKPKLLKRSNSTRNPS